jgi:hypothetical protein
LEISSSRASELEHKQQNFDISPVLMNSVTMKLWTNDK